MRILIVEDELSLREGLFDLMVGDGHTVTCVADGAAAVEVGVAEHFDVVLLDRMLPKMDGMEVCRRLRAARPTMSILMLTARASEDDKVAGLSEGADDYLTKPFAARELLARVRALGRRHLGNAASDVIELGQLHLELGQLRGTRQEVEFSLSPREAGIIRLLYRSRPNSVSRAELLESVWGARGSIQTRAVDMAMATLRKKLEDNSSKPRFLVTVKGIGYRWGEG
ncbi:MAG: response regulator transcription factor [Kofleriaceae bacterium]|nr:response regulator transcription factor [Kofleriaceae bacterium]